MSLFEDDEGAVHVLVGTANLVRGLPLTHSEL